MTKPRSTPRGVRYDPDLEEFQLRCDDCADRGRGPSYWPMTLDFWAPQHGLARCRACHNHKRAETLRKLLAADPERRARKLAANRALRKVMWPMWEERRRERMAEDPDRLARYREQHRLASARYRARLRDEVAA